MKLKCRFGEPLHGWLPIEISAGDFRFEDTLSKVPENPVDGLVYALGRAVDGLEAEVWLNLEPASYYLRFLPLEGDRYDLRIEFSGYGPGPAHARDPVFQATGTREEIILPFWRACRELASHAYSRSNWSECDEPALDRLTKLIRSG